MHTPTTTTRDCAGAQRRMSSRIPGTPIASNTTEGVVPTRLHTDSSRGPTPPAAPSPPARVDHLGRAQALGQPAAGGGEVRGHDRADARDLQRRDHREPYRP